MFNRGSSYFHVALTTVRHLLSVLQMCGAATAMARLPTVDSLTGGTTRRLALVQRSVHPLGKSSSADRGNVEHRRVEPCTPEESACTEFVPEPAKSAD